MNSKTLYFKGLSHQDFIHQEDKADFESLMKIRGVTWFTKKVLELGIEKMVRMKLIADGIKVSENQCSKLYEEFLECCRILNIKKTPDLYVEANLMVNAYTTGFDNPVVVVTSGAVARMNEAEMRFLLGHELGHYKSEHILYIMLGNYLNTIINAVGDMTLGIGSLLGKGFMMSFLNWSRKAEYSADRAGLLTCQSKDVALRALLKLGAPLEVIFNQINIESLIAQADEFEELSGEVISGLYRVMFDSSRTHPWMVLRLKELNEWANSERYTTLRARAACIGTNEKLLQFCGTRKTRADMAALTGIDEETLLEWVATADLTRIRGVGEQYAELLKESGVKTLDEFAQTPPQQVYDKILELNNLKLIVNKIPPLTTVENWISQAKELPKRVEY